MAATGEHAGDRTGLSRLDWTVLAGLVTAKLAIHLLLSGRYGYHGDEFYFIECGKRLAFGYVDHAPLVPWIARLSGALFGYGLLSLRFFPAVAGALSLVLTVLIVREWGGARFAQLVAGLTMLIAPTYLRAGSLLCLPAFEPVYWMLGTYLIVLLIRRDAPRLWVLVGLVAGVGLLNKHTMLFWGLGIAAGLVLTPQRRHLRNPWFWAGGVVALLIILPNLVWQYHNDWATLEFLRQISQGMLAAVPRSLFLLGQLVYMHPVSLPVSAAGLAYFFTAAGKPYRVFGWLYVVVLVLLLIIKGKPYYLAPAYPLLFAGGAVMLQTLLARRRWARLLIVVALLIGGVVTAPLSLPVLPLQVTDALIGRVFRFAIDDPTLLTGEFHDQYGWQEQTATIAAVYNSLSPEEQSRATILTRKYNQAAAVNFFGRAYGLPTAVSGHMTYHIWGPAEPTPRVIIAYGMTAAVLHGLCGDISEAARTFHPLAPADNNDLPVYVCRAPTKSLQEAWPDLKRYDHSNPSPSAFATGDRAGDR